jgi:hypothetical protein
MTMPRKRPPGYTSRNGWGHIHQQRRKQLEPLVRAGTVNCARCGKPIEPHEPWALDHNDDRTGYLGASHMRCNAAAGAHKTNRRHGLPVTRIVSQRWTDHPDTGTVIHRDNHTADYYDGHEWRTVKTRDLAL